MSSPTATGDESSPVQDEEFLLRRFPNLPDQFNFDLEVPRFNAFLPLTNDTDGLSMNRENFITAEAMRAAASSPTIREKGGVAAMHTVEIIKIGLTIVPSHSEATPGHVVVPEMNRVDYDYKATDGTKPGKKRIRDLADKLARVAKVRIKPTK